MMHRIIRVAESIASWTVAFLVLSFIYPLAVMKAEEDERIRRIATEAILEHDASRGHGIERFEGCA